MMTPFDTALLKHRPGHLHIPSDAERAARSRTKPLSERLSAGLARFLRAARRPIGTYPGAATTGARS